MCKMFTALCGTVVSHEFVPVSYCHKYYLYFFLLYTTLYLEACICEFATEVYFASVFGMS